MAVRFVLFVLAVAALVPSALSLSAQTTLTGVSTATTATFAAEYAAELESLTTNSAGRFSDIVHTASGTGDTEVTSITFTVEETLDEDLPSAQSIYDEYMNLFRYGSTTALFTTDTLNWAKFTTAVTETCADGTMMLICDDLEEDDSNGAATTLLIAGLVFVAWIVFLAITLEMCLRFNSGVGAVANTQVTITAEDKV